MFKKQFLLKNDSSNTKMNNGILKAIVNTLYYTDYYYDIILLL